MKCLERNKVRIYYSNFIDKVPFVDGNGFETGEYILSYSSPVETKCNIGIENGNATNDIFGTNTDYTRQLIFDNDVCINEQTILFIGIQPKLNGTEWNYNYIVKR